jgi:CRISPR-associated protein (TIGR02710 family)
MSALRQKREYMRRIFRGEVSYGEGTPTEQASRYRIEEMYDDIVAAALANPSDQVSGVHTLVSLSGFSPETTLLAFELVRPQRLTVVSSENVSDKFDIISTKLNGRLKPSQIRFEPCDPADPLGIYDIVKKAVRPPSGEGRVSAIIDITGGKKVMSASAALAATQLDLQMCYVNGDFDPEMRVAVPGTERLKVLSNPTRLFGDQDMDAAKAMFRSGVYAGAKVRFAELTESMSEPVQARFLCDLSELYQAWCDLDAANLSRLAVSVKEKLLDPRLKLLVETRGRLAAQLEFVDRLVDRDGSALLLNFFLLGEHYQAMGRFDFAALLFYRTIEQSFSERLVRNYPGFDLETPDYSLLGPNEEELRQKYLATVTKIHPGGDRKALPWSVGLLDAMLLLHIVGDRLLPAADINDLRGVSHVQKLVTTRNRSVLAHGVESVTQEQCDELRARALRNLRAFWRLHHGNENVDDRIATLRFVTEAKEMTEA